MGGIKLPPVVRGKRESALTRGRGGLLKPFPLMNRAPYITSCLCLATPVATLRRGKTVV
jgi:hypothetical protein